MSYKFKQRIAAFVGAFMLVGAMPTASYVYQAYAAAYVSAPKCTATLDVVLDCEKYVKGDIVTATLGIKDLSDEAQAGVKIAALEAHLTFDSTKLTFLKDDSVFSDNFSGENLPDDCDINVSTKRPGKLYAYFIYNTDGYQLNNEGGGGDYLEVAKLKFKVNDNVNINDEIKIEFDNDFVSEGSNGSQDLKYENLVVKPLDGNINPNDAAFELETCSNLSATIADIVFAPSDGLFNAVTAKISVPADVKASSEYTSLCFVAELYDTSTGLTKDVKYVDIRKNPDFSGVEFDNITSTNDLKIRCYLWDSLTNMLPLTDDCNRDIHIINQYGN